MSESLQKELDSLKRQIQLSTVVSTPDPSSPVKSSPITSNHHQDSLEAKLVQNDPGPIDRKIRIIKPDKTSTKQKTIEISSKNLKSSENQSDTSTSQLSKLNGELGKAQISELDKMLPQNYVFLKF